MAEETIASITGGDDVSQPLDAYTEHRNRMKLPDALMGGTKTMREAKTIYLPQEEGETAPAYEARLDRTTLTNYYKNSVSKLNGEVFKEQVTLSEDIPEQFEELVSNIDNEGNNLTTFISSFFKRAIHNGVDHIMVEYPEVEGITEHDHKQAGARPFWVEIKPTNIIGWRFESINGKKKLVQLRVKEVVEKEDGKYGLKEVERIRYYYPGGYEVYELSGEGTWVVAKDEDGNEIIGKTTLDYIPLVTLMLGEPLSDLTAEPCLDDLAWLNMTHWQSSSDQRNILHFARLITYFGKMLEVDDAGQVVFSANRLVHSSNKDADLKVVEHNGAGIEAGRNDLRDLEVAMAMYGLSLMLPKTGTVTATEKAIDKAESDSDLGEWVRRLDSALEQLLEYTCKWLGVNPDGQLMANNDFSPLGSESAALLVTAFEKGLLPRQMVVTELMARGIITQEFDLIDLVAMLEDDQRSQNVLGTLGNFPKSDQGEPTPAQ